MPLDEAARQLLFTEARTPGQWRDEPVAEEALQEMYALLRLGPTSANCSPARFLFLRSPEAKQRLRPALSAGNLDKAMAAPVVAVVAHDPRFYDQLPKLFPHADARAWFAGNAALADETALRNGTLQGDYLVMAARAVGLDAAPMSGFDTARVDAIFFVASGWRSNFLVNLGHGDLASLGPRSPRLTFGEACLVL